MQIRDIKNEPSSVHRQAAVLLKEEFREMAPHAWPDDQAAMNEVKEALADDRICLGAFNNAGELIGWIGAIPQYSHAWELHPLVVDSRYRGKGVGSALIQQLEKQLRQRKVVTLYLGSDDEMKMTSLSEKDLYPNLFNELKNIKNIKGHPFEFYERNGFKVVGVIPDANGIGKPDIFMAKRIL